MLEPVTPISTIDLFPPLNVALLDVLRGLTLAEWRLPTACPGWSVKDVTAHLLGGSLSRVKDERDPGPIQPAPSFDELLAWIDRENAEWVQAAHRISPSLLVEFLALADRRLVDYFRSLPPEGRARAAVVWAGESLSANWFDIAREYTEKWLHQQHIREAAGRPLLTNRFYLYPVLDTFLRALPYTFRAVPAPAGAALVIEISGEAGGSWTLLREDDKWRLYAGAGEQPAALVRLEADTAWRLFTKGISIDAARARIQIEGNDAFGDRVLSAVSIMA